MTDDLIIIKTPIGPSFEAEWRQAGLSGNGFFWDPEGVTILPTMTSADVTKLRAVISAHNPNMPNPAGPDLALRTSKVAFFRRATEDEAAQFVADLTEASPRLKAIFDSVNYLVPGTPEYPALRAAVEARVTHVRADELLAPSND